MLIAIAFVVLQAVKRVPSRTLLAGAHVILMLFCVSLAMWTYLLVEAVEFQARRAYRDPTALYKFDSASPTSLLETPLVFKVGVATFPAILWRLVSAIVIAKASSRPS